MKLELYINNQLADIMDDTIIAVTKTYESLTNPTSYYCDFSKTVTLPISKRNNDIFDNFNRLDSVVTDVTIDYTKKIPFVILDNKKLVMQGYLHLDNANTIYDDECYEVTLYSSFGLIINELKLLTFNPNASDIDPMYIIDTPFGNNLRINRNIVKRSFEQQEHLLGSDDVIDWIGFIPTYQGKYSEFSSDKRQVLTSGKTNDLSRERDEHYIREFRSYYQQPFIWVDKLWKVAKDKIEDITDYTFNLDKSWFSANNPYYKDLIYTCPSLFNGDDNYKEHSEQFNPELNIIEHTKTSQSTLTTPSNIQLTGLDRYSGDTIFSNGIFNGDSSFGSTVFKSKIRLTLFCPNSEDSIRGYAKIQKDNPFYVRIKAVNANTNEVIEGAERTYLLYSNSTEASDHTYDEAIDLGVTSRLYPDVEIGVDNREILNGSDAGSMHTSSNGYYWDTVIDLTLNVTHNAPYKIIVDVYNGNNHKPFEYSLSTLIPRWDWLWSDLFYTGSSQTNTDMGYSMYFDIIECSITTQENIRSESNLTLYRIFPKETTLCDVLLNYSKMFGLIWTIDEDSKELTVMSRNRFYQDYSILDWTDKVDRSKEFKFNPLSFDKRFVEFNFDEGKCGRLEKYEAKYEYTYGTKKLDTEYEFNNDSNKLFNGLVPSVISQKKQFSRMFNTEYEDRPNFMGYNYMIYPDEHYVDNDSEGSNAGISGAFYFRNGTFIPDPRLSLLDDMGNTCVFITDDTTYQMQTQNYCWNECGENLILANALPDVSTISNEYDGKRYSVHFTSPKEYFFQQPTDTVYYIYPKYWEDYINERYCTQNKKLTAYVYITPEEFSLINFREFVKIDNILYHIDKISDYNFNSNEPTKIELVQVWDLSAYTSGQNEFGYLFTDPEMLTVTTTDEDVTVYASGSWSIDTVPDWITCSANDNTLTIRANSNPTFYRESAIKLTLDGTGVYYRMIVNQQPTGCYINTDRSTIVFNENGGTEEVFVDTSSTGVTVTSNRGWLRGYIFENNVSQSARNDRGLHLFVSARPNNTTVGRNGVLTLSATCGGNTYTTIVNVGQQASRTHITDFNDEIITEIDDINILDSNDNTVVSLVSGNEYHFTDLFPEELDTNSIRITSGMVSITGNSGKQTVVFTPQLANGDTVGGGIITAKTKNGGTVTYNYNVTSESATDPSRRVRIRANAGGKFKVAVNSGTAITTDYFDGVFVDGTTITIDGVPDVGYGFDRWVTGSGTENLNSKIVFTVSSSLVYNNYISYNVYFKMATATAKITITTDGNGTFTIGNNATVYNTYTKTVAVGTVLTNITVTPATGYAFYKWSDGSTVNGRDYTVMGDTVLTALMTGGSSRSQITLDGSELIGASNVVARFGTTKTMSTSTGSTTVDMINNGNYNITVECTISDNQTEFAYYDINGTTYSVNPLTLNNYSISADTTIKTYVSPLGVDYFYVENISESTNDISITKNNSDAPTLSVEYSLDQVEWTSMGETSTDPISVSIEPTEKVYLRCRTNAWCINNYYNNITSTDKINVGGDIMSLLYGEEFNGKTLDSTNNISAFNHLFYENDMLVNASDLILTSNTASYCYQNMFYGCTSLETAPILPAEVLAKNCYFSMFEGCSALTQAPELPATELASGCYRYMFYDCSGLTTAPILPATELSYNCYYAMFWGCTGLTTTPELPAEVLADDCYTDMFGRCTALTETSPLLATELASGCYQYMFGGCTSLETAPILPAEVLAEKCYRSMFNGCTSLTAAPELPATTLANSCYNGMFDGCTSLTQAPALPATELSYNCYRAMFSGCTGLTTTPELPAEVLVDGCYSIMFYNCTSLKYVTTYATDISATNCLSNWLYNVSDTGDFYNNGGAAFTVDDPSGIPLGWTQHPTPITSSYFYVEDRSGSDNTLSIVKSDSQAYSIRVYKSTDQTNWTELGTTSTTALTATIPANGKLYLRANCNCWSSNGGGTYGQNSITCSGNYNIGGNIMSLLKGGGYYDTDFDSDIRQGVFKKLFSGSTTLVSCENLTLPNSTASNCYNMMFSGCTALTQAPALPATSTNEYCYYFMFNNCTSLTTAPILNATSINNHSYYRMFNNCSSLNSVTTYANSRSNSDACDYWLYGVAATGDFYNYGAITYGNNIQYGGIPEGWTIHTTL